MAKPRQKTDDMIDAGMKVLYAKGYHAMSMQDIANANEMTKGALYGYFKSKEDFAVKAIERYTETLSHCLEEVLLHGEGKALDRLNALWLDWSKNQFTKYNGCGCLAGNMSQEMSAHSELIRKATETSFNKLESIYKRCLDRAIEEGDLPKDINTNIVGSIIYNGWQGAMLRAKSEQNPKHLLEFIEYVFDYILKK